MLELHPTVKPTQLLVDAILDVSKRGEWVLDPFAGSGSTLIAAHQVDRICAAIEIDCHYCDVVVERFERFTGDEARHAMTGRIVIHLMGPKSEGLICNMAFNQNTPDR
jgi:DNA modification methylase